jgi:hypothetical protein
MLPRLTQPALLASRVIDSASHLAQHLLQGLRLSRESLNATMVETSASGFWSQQDSFVAAAIAPILALRNRPFPTNGTEIIGVLDATARCPPTQTVMSEGQKAITDWIHAHAGVAAAPVPLAA